VPSSLDALSGALPVEASVSAASGPGAWGLELPGHGTRRVTEARNSAILDQNCHRNRHNKFCANLNSSKAFWCMKRWPGDLLMVPRVGHHSTGEALGGALTLQLKELKLH